MKPRHVVFDLGHVLLNFDPELAYLDLIPDEDERKTFLKEVCSRDWITAQDRVQAWHPGEAMLIDTHPDKAHLIRAFRQRWHDMVPSQIDGTVEVLEQLSDFGVDLTALTNFNGETFDEAVERFGFFQHFRAITVSGKVSMLKPERAIFDHHARAHGLEPAATLFIDDLETNVAAAQAAGWQAIRFSGPDALKADLKSVSLLP